MPKRGAPAGLERVRRFVNSAELEHGADELASPAVAYPWLAAEGYELECEPTEAELQTLRSFREAVRAELVAHNDGTQAADAWRQLAAFLAEASLRIVPLEPGSLALAPASGNLAQRVVAEVSARIYDAIAEGTWARLKACRKGSCHWAFYDHSKNGSAAWCDMAVCGNRVKAARRRSREKTAKPATFQ